jgi:hypothetical protein
LSCDATAASVGESEEQSVLRHTLGRYAKYACDNLRHWQRLLDEGSTGLRAEDLVLVTGCVTTCAWVTSVRIEAVSPAADLRASARHWHEAGACNVRASFPSSLDVTYNYGSSRTGERDQCLFVKGYKVYSTGSIKRDQRRASGE